MTAIASPPLATVLLLEMPLDVYARSTQHWEELMREFALISFDTQREVEPVSRPLPHRLIDLVDELTHNFSAFTVNTEAERDAALERGERTIDLSYQVPRNATDGVRRLEALLEEVDDFCRSGQHLITLATPPESLAFRRWYLGEFLEQIGRAADPQPWPAYVARHHGDDPWAHRSV